MASWIELARENRLAASRLFAVHAMYRSSVSRAYYAVYSLVTHELNSVPLNWPAGDEGPPHRLVSKLLRTHMRRLPSASREQVAEMVGRLYAMRCRADYHPSDFVDSSEARVALGLMTKVFNVL